MKLRGDKLKKINRRICRILLTGQLEYANIYVVRKL